MKILLVTDEKFYAGNLMKGLDDKGHDVTLVSSQKASKFSAEDLKEYDAIVQKYPHAVPQIFEDSNEQSFDAATRLLREMRMRAPKAAMLCIPSLLDSNTENMQQKLNAREITFMGEDKIRPEEMVKTIEAAVQKSRAT